MIFIRYLNTLLLTIGKDTTQHYHIYTESTCTCINLCSNHVIFLPSLLPTVKQSLNHTSFCIFIYNPLNLNMVYAKLTRRKFISSENRVIRNTTHSDKTSVLLIGFTLIKVGFDQKNAHIHLILLI